MFLDKIITRDSVNFREFFKFISVHSNFSTRETKLYSSSSLQSFWEERKVERMQNVILSM